MSDYTADPAAILPNPAGALAGRRALVTGGGTGMGEAMAKALAALGVRVVVCGRRTEPLEETVEEIKAAGGELTGVLIALDRQERVLPDEPGTAVSRLRDELGVPVESLLTLQDVIEYLDLNGGADNHPDEILKAIRAYQAAYCE